MPGPHSFLEANPDRDAYINGPLPPANHAGRYLGGLTGDQLLELRGYTYDRQRDMARSAERLAAERAAAAVTPQTVTLRFPIEAVGEAPAATAAAPTPAT